MESSPLRSLVTALAAWMTALILAAAPAAAYIVVLKDGSQITTSKKYERRGDEVLLILPSGTETSYPASDIDFEKTEDLNRGTNLTNAKIIQGGQARQAKKEDLEDDKPSFGDLISGRDGGGLSMPEATRREDRSTAENGPALPTTSAGYVDLTALRRDPYPDTDIAGELMSYLKGQGNETVRIFRGSEDGRPMIEIVTQSEASVFKALRDTANCLVQVADRYPSKVEAIELLLVTESQVRAGQFQMTRERANLLVTGRLEPPAFFLRFVEF